MDLGVPPGALTYVVEALSGTGLQRLKVESQVCLYLGRDIA